MRPSLRSVRARTPRPAGHLSFWHDSLEPGDELRPRPALPADVDVDVAVVGAGFTGLWTAYYLARADPHLRVTVIEREVAGFGASGRNGGWCVGDQAAPLHALERAWPGAAAAMVEEMHRSVDEVGAVAATEGIDCGFAKGGAIYLATNPFQLRRLRRLQAVHEQFGLGDTYQLLSPRETTDVVNATGMFGGLFNRHAAALHPARLARGLAVAVERLGATVHEGTAATAIEPRHVRTERGTVRAEIVVQATEAYTPQLDGQRRAMLPLGNYMIATEPIPDEIWAEIGLRNREVFEVMVPMVSYGQRTADGRIALGGLGAPYWWGSGVPSSPMSHEKTAERLHALLVEKFPVLAGIGVTHQWGGVLGVPRDYRPGVGLDRSTGLAWAGGYVGSGVAASNAAGRTLAALITGTQDDLVRLPWVGHRSPKWEREPLRWIGVNARKLQARTRGRIESAGLVRRNRVANDG